MKTKIFQKNEFSVTCLFAFFAGLLFITASLCVAFFIPAYEPAPEIVELPEPEEQEEIIIPFFEDVGTLSVFPAEDEALVLYRDAASRKAVEWFYASVVGSKEIAIAVLSEADKNDISPSLAFSLAYVESRYDIHAKNVNKNKTIDRGLFQLNSASFPKLNEEDFFDPAVSAKHGMAHLRFCLDTAGNEISALAMYNAGANKVRSNSTPQLTLNYIGQIMTCRDNIDRLFADKVLSYYDTIPFGGQAVQVAMAK